MGSFKMTDLKEAVGLSLEKTSMFLKYAKLMVMFSFEEKKKLGL